jgi:serine/threonine protein kinase
MIIGNYRVLNQIAEGGFGRTYLAEHTVLGTKVCIKHALKVSHEDELLLIEEAKAIWDLRHFGIPAVRDILKLPDGSLALVMSYVPGPTLAQLVEKHDRLDPEHVAWITERCINILKYLHYHGVIHGDVKPQNIIIQPETHSAVLVDYGLSAIRPSRDTESKGYTPLFAPPEQMNASPLLPESDFYSLGVTMIYSLGGDVERRKVPAYTPDAMCAFIKRLVVHDVLSRPNWRKENLQETFQTVREKSFGRRTSGMKPLPKL